MLHFTRQCVLLNIIFLENFCVPMCLRFNSFGGWWSGHDVNLLRLANDCCEKRLLPLTGRIVIACSVVICVQGLLSCFSFWQIYQNYKDSLYFFHCMHVCSCFRECTRSGFCNFMHLKPISRELRRELYSRKIIRRSVPLSRGNLSGRELHLPSLFMSQNYVLILLACNSHNISNCFLSFSLLLLL